MQNVDWTVISFIVSSLCCILYGVLGVMPSDADTKEHCTAVAVFFFLVASGCGIFLLKTAT